ncbi:unnamed protein product [Pleuronectes platessa]|uniref:Uncharacterized protein n=1 Tax=Pleuronectes platessa TaxID=8262 RepID=A0A9N7TJ70_PLEPL|nr:unnamed protein product [Pleuronectes platessa]
MPRLWKQLLRRPPLHAAGSSVCGTPQRFFGGEVLFRGASRRQCPSAVRKAGTGWWGPGTAVGGSDSGRPWSLLTDLLSYGARWGNPPFARGGLPAVRLGWRLAPD